MRGCQVTYLSLDIPYYYIGYTLLLCRLITTRTICEDDEDKDRQALEAMDEVFA